MRPNALRELLEGFARRSPGWGTKFTTVGEDGKPKTIRFSLGYLRREGVRNAVEPTPRADKGTDYVINRRPGPNRHGQPRGATRVIMGVAG